MKGRKFYLDVMQGPTEVTGSFNLCVGKIDEKTVKFAVDCGMYQEQDYVKQNTTFLANPENVDFAILTHNHVDHNGRLPLFVRQGFRGPIYTSKVTAAILATSLYDNLKVINDSSKRQNNQGLYDETDVAQTMKQVVGCEYNQPVRVNENVTLTFVPNGHLIGAACVLVQIHCPGEKKDINIFFTGDYNNKNLFFKVAPVRKWIAELPLTLVTESTYGYMDSSEIKEVFRKNVLTALKQKKSIIIPVFSLGRAQEILYILKEMQKRYPKLFENVPIYYDGNLSFTYTKFYGELQEVGLLHFYKDKQEFLPNNLNEVFGREERKRIIQSDDCKIVITTSGMGSYGPAQTYIPWYIERPDALIHFTGYCAEGTLGYRLKNTEKGDIVDVAGLKTCKWADVEFTNEFSAHAKADELIKFLKKFQKPQFIMVNHGQDQVKDMFAERILREIDLEHVGILGRDYIYRIDPNGFVKSLPAKFL